MQPPNLRFIVKSTILKYLVCSNDISRDHLVMLEYFQCFGQGVFGDEILSQIIDDFPDELTDELLIALSPPHLRHLKLTKCNRLTCSGLQKTVAKCQQLQALDFTECLHLLHPIVFCCLKDKASNLVSLSLENSQVVSDDIVQVALMCCPGLKHLNLSSCRNITDAAFAVPNSESNTSETATQSSHPGCNLTSVDVSGCQALSTVAVKHLVAICGPNLTSINLAWTGVSCTALLYLAGLNMDQVAQLMRETDPASDAALQPQDHIKWDLPPVSSECDGMLKAEHNNQTGLQEQESVTYGEEQVHGFPVVANCSENFQNVTKDDVVSLPCLSSTSPVEEELPIDPCECTERQLNKDELVTCKSSATDDLQHFTESSDEESDDSFKTACDEIEPCLPSEEEVNFPAPVQNNLRHEEFQERCLNDGHSHSDKIKFDEAREFCWSVIAGENSVSRKTEVKENSCEKVFASGDGTLRSCGEVETCCKLHSWEMVGCEHHVKRTPAMLSPCFEQSKGELTTTEERCEVWFDCTESQSTMSFEVRSMKGSQIVYQCALETSSLEKDCDNAVAMKAGKKPEYPTMICDGGKDEEVQKCYKSESSALHPARLDHEVTDCHSLPCKKVMDEEQEMSQDWEPVCHVDMNVEETNNECRYTDLPCNVVKDQTPLTWSVMPHRNVKSNGLVKPCHGDEVTLPDVPFEEQINKQSTLSFKTCADAEESKNSDCLLSGSVVIQFGDLAQAQMYQPKITSLDICTNIFYQSKPLGVVCLKVFSKACKRLKHFAVSWSELDDDVLMYLLKNEPELESLSLVDCENLSNLSLSTIPVHCPKLTSFDLKGMCYVTDYGLMPLARSNDLQSLSLAEAAITDWTLESIAKGCGAKLKELDISWCEDITDRGMSITAKNCPTLRHLSLRQCSASHLTLAALAANCHLISYLNIAGINSLTDAALSNLAKNMPLLREIDASWNSSLSDIGISALLEFCTQLNKAVLCGLKCITSQPFLAIIGDLGRWRLLEELWKCNRRSKSAVPNGKVALKSCVSETAKSIGDQIPWRSMSYAPSLRQVLLEYSDKVNDDHLAAVVAVCRGTLFVKDYYGQPIEPKWIFR